MSAQNQEELITIDSLKGPDEVVDKHVTEVQGGNKVYFKTKANTFAAIVIPNYRAIFEQDSTDKKGYDYWEHILEENKNSSHRPLKVKEGIKKEHIYHVYVHKNTGVGIFADDSVNTAPKIIVDG